MAAAVARSSDRGGCAQSAPWGRAEKPAHWYDAVYDHSRKYRLSYEDPSPWPVWQRILERLDAFGRPAILEIGCGPGQLAAAIRDRVAASAYLGIDFSATAIEMARVRAPELMFVVANALDAPEVKSFSYDVVICTEVLEHIERDRTRSGAGDPAPGPSPPYPATGRHRTCGIFATVAEVEARYHDLIDDLAAERMAIGRHAHLYLICGVVAERA